MGRVPMTVTIDRPGPLEPDLAPPAVEVRALTKAYGDLTAVKSVSFDVRAG